MAERRMFSKAVINSARFLRMPATARLLYYDLGMDADDDGVVEAFVVMRKTGANEDDLKILVTKDFLSVLDADELIMFITDWNQNNSIQKDRYHKSFYSELLYAKTGILPRYEDKVPDGYKRESPCIQDVSKVETENSKGNVSKSKNSKDKVNIVEERRGGTGVQSPEDTIPEYVCALIKEYDQARTLMDTNRCCSLRQALMNYGYHTDGSKLDDGDEPF